MVPPADRSPRRYWLPALALSILVTLLVAPQTRWIVRQQAATEFLPHDLWETLRSADAEQKALLEHPGDVGLQTAVAFRVPPPAGMPDSTGRVQQLQKLILAFPNSSTLYAHLLRYMTTGQIHVHRDEEYLLTGDTPPPNKPTPPKPEQLAAFDHAAAEGERLEPDNAYFPFIRAVGLYAQHQDEAAIAAIERAAQKPHFEDHSREEATDADRLIAKIYGTTSAVARGARYASLLFPHYASLRGATRMAIYSALTLEQQGHVEEGLRIRHNIMRLGELMRAQSHSAIGSLVGIALMETAISRPGGASPIKTPTSSSEAERARLRQERATRYMTFLANNGHQADVTGVEQMLATGRETSRLLKKGIERNGFNIWGVMRLGLCWAGSLLLLSNLIGLLVFGGAAWLASRIRLKRGLGLARFLFATGILLGTGYWQMHAMSQTNGSSVMLVESLTATSSMLTRDTGPEQGHMALWPLAMFLLLLVPIGTTLLLALASKVSKVPVASGVGRGLRGITIPLACAVVLLYNGVVVATVMEEKEVNQTLDRTIQQEGPYLAECVGEKWP